MDKLWGGWFGSHPDEVFPRFNTSRRFDRRLLQAEKLFLLTNVEGLFVDPPFPPGGFPILLKQAEAQFKLRAVAEGMIPRLAPIIWFLQGGVKNAHTINGARPNALFQEISWDRGSGKMMTS